MGVRKGGFHYRGTLKIGFLQECAEEMMKTDLISKREAAGKLVEAALLEYVIRNSPKKPVKK